MLAALVAGTCPVEPVVTVGVPATIEVAGMLDRGAVLLELVIGVRVVLPSAGAALVIDISNPD